MVGGLISYGAGLPPYGIPLALAVAAVGIWCLAHPERSSVETPSACPHDVTARVPVRRLDRLPFTAC